MLADSFKLPRPRGALVSQVEPKGPAAEAGLKAGDVILAVDGKQIELSSEVPPLVAAIKPGKQATLTVWRDKSERSMRVKVGELEEEPVVALRNAPADSGTGKLGLAVRPLNGSERERLGTTGRLVVEDADGPAALAGVERGDVILGVNGVPVASVGEFRTAVDASGSTVALLIQRDDAADFRAGADRLLMQRGGIPWLAASLLLAAAPVVRAAEGTRAPGTAFTDCDGCPEMVVVPAGSFVMGTPGAAPARGAGAAESQAFVVEIPRPFALGRFEVTRGEYARFIADSGHEPQAGCRVWDPDARALQRRPAPRLAGRRDAGIARRRPSRQLRIVHGRAGLRAVAVGEDRLALPAAVRSRVGVRGAGRQPDPAAVGRRRGGRLRLREHL